jgi:hypothetical protein
MEEIMPKMAFLFFLVALCFVPVVHAQSAPEPEPELKKLQVLVGRWTYDGEYKSGFWGPGGKKQGEATYRFILHGFVLEGQETEKSGDGQSHLLEIDAYDVVNRHISSSVYTDDGTTYSAVISLAGNTITWEGTVSFEGKQFRVRAPFVLSSDGTSGTARGELSPDGKTWQTYFEAKYSRTK